MQFARAHCAAWDAREDIGASKLRKIVDAIHFVLLALPIAATRRPQYDFLVYNASVTYWTIARPLMKKSTIQFIVPSLTKIIDALKTTGEKDMLWLARLQLAMVHAQVDAKQLASAAKSINDLVDTQLTPLLTEPNWSSRADFQAINEEALRVQIHLGSFKDPECQKIVPNVKKVVTAKRASMVLKLQCIKSNIISGTLESAYVELVQEATGLTAFSVALSDPELVAAVHSLTSEAIDTDIVAEVALHAAFHNYFRVAYCCEIVLQLKGKQTKDPKIRVLHDVLKGVLLVIQPIQQAIRDRIPLRQRQALLLSRRVEAMKTFERALLASKRQQNPILIENVCLYAWNLSMPLLQPHVSSTLTRMYTLSTQALEEIESLALELRTRLHLEAARLDFSADFLVKANSHVSKGLLLDYGTIVDHASGSMTIDDLCKHDNEWAMRAVDIHLAPLQKNIQLKLTLEDPETYEDQIKTLMGQLKESKDNVQRTILFDKSVALMKKAIDTADETHEQRTSVELLLLWCEMSSLAWHELHDRQKALYLTEKILAVYFAQPEGSKSSSIWCQEKSLMILEVDLRMRMIEILAAELKARLEDYEQAKAQADPASSSHRTKQHSRTQSRHTIKEQDVELTALVQLARESFMLGINYPSDIHLDTTGVDENDDTSILIKERKTILTQEIQKIKNCILMNVVAAISTATRIGWTFVIENTCIYLWNYHFHLFRKLLCASSAVSNDDGNFQVQWVLPECINAFEAAYASLDAISVDHQDNNIELLTFIGLGLATIYENMGRWEKVMPLADAFLKRKAISSLPGAVSLHSNMVSCLHLKYFAELKTRGQLAQNSKEIAPVDGSNDLLKVVSYLEAIETIFRIESGTPAQQLERAQALYEKSILLWSSISGDQITAIDTNPSDHTIEELQRQMEIYIEIWVRIGCSAFRFQQFRYAIECAERALRTLSFSSSLIIDNAWSWITLAEILCSRGILALGSGETVIWQLILASLKHLVNAAKYSIKYASAPLLGKKAGEIAWNAVTSVIANEGGHDESNQNETEASWKQTIELLVMLLKYLREASEGLQARDAAFYGEMVLLVLKVCEKTNEWTQGLAVCDGVLAAPSGHKTLQLPATTSNEIRTFQAIASAQIGKQLSSSNNSGGGKGAQARDSVLQAQILRKIAFSSWKDPPAQLRALSAAFSELDGKIEEQALVQIDLAEWLYTNQFPWQDVDAYLLSATNMLIACQQNKLATAAGTATASRRSGVASSSSKSDADARIYSSLWLAEKLVRAFVMRALTASTCLDRWTFAINAVTQVQNAWVEIIMIKNEVDAQSEFEQLASGSNQIDFDEWKQSRPSRCESPHTWNEWIAFYLTFDTNADSRFYMPWTKALLSASSSNVLHFTQPILSGFFLERLLNILEENGQFEFMLPAICLYQLLFHAYFPQKTKTMEIWLELTLFGLLERLNLSAYALPLQNALDLLQVHANAIVKEIQLSSAESHGSLRVNQTRNRVVLQATQVDLIDKGITTAELFLRFGFVRQAKTMLEVVAPSVEQSKDPSNQCRSACLVLKSKILDMEGQHVLASETFEQALICESIDLLTLIQWTHEYACLVLDKSKALQRLEELFKIVVQVVCESEKASAITLQGQTQSKSTSIGDDISGKYFDLDGVLAIADIKFKCSELILRTVLDAYARDNHDTEWLALLDTSRNAFEECIQFYTLVDSRRKLGVALATYSKHLLHLYTVADQRSYHLQEAKSMAQRAVFLFESMHFPVNLPEVGTETSPIATTLEIDIAYMKSLLAEIELLLSQSTEVVRQEDMTWYRFDQDSKRDVVIKWLHQTVTELKGDIDSNRGGGDLSRAMVLASSSAALLRRSGQDECCATAEALALQCARFSYFRGDAQSKIQKRLWTRFTSPDAPYATWICCSHFQTVSNTATVPKDEGIDVEDESQDAEAIDGALLEMTSNLEAYQRIALEKRDMKLLRLCSYELVQTYGCHRPLECARSLLMYQSVLVQAYLVDLFDKCASPTNVEKLHMARMQKLQTIHRNAAANSVPYQLSMLYLDQQSDAVKRMSVLTPVDVILATLPPQVRIFSLQLSPDRCFLYAALVGNGDRHFAMARMECVDTTLMQLEQLRERVLCWRRSYGKLLLEYEDMAVRDEDFDFVAMDSLANQQLSCSNDGLEKEFSGILIDMIELFSPLFGHSTLQAELQNELPNNPLILLVDRELELLPLEALPAFDKADSISRDLSIHVLYRRLLAAKTQPLRRDDIRVIVDPHQEDPGSSGNTMDTVVQHFTKRNNAPFSNWKDAVDHGQIPSVDDWQQVLMGRHGGGLVFVGGNRVVGSSLPFERLMAMNLSLNCHVLLLLDRAENAKSLRRQSKLDSEKCTWELALEDDGYATVALLTLSGINVLLVNQWSTTFTSNRRLANGLLNGLAKGFPIGKALKKHMESTSTGMTPLDHGGSSNTTSATSLAASATNSNTSSSTSLTPSSPQRPAKRQLKNRLRYNPVVYGLAYMALRSGE